MLTSLSQYLLAILIKVTEQEKERKSKWAERCLSSQEHLLQQKTS